MIAVIPETVRNPDRAIRIRPRLGVPPGMRAVMIGECLGVFAAFSIRVDGIGHTARAAFAVYPRAHDRRD